MDVTIHGDDWSLEIVMKKNFRVQKRPASNPREQTKLESNGQ